MSALFINEYYCYLIDYYSIKPITGVKQILWLLTSTVISVQLYACMHQCWSRQQVLIYTILFAAINILCAYLAYWTIAAYIIIVLGIFVSFFISYKGLTVTVFSLWSVSYIIITVVFSAHGTQLIGQYIAYTAGALIAYASCFIRLPQRKKDQLIYQIKQAIQYLQYYMHEVFDQILMGNTDDHAMHHDKHHQAYKQARFALVKMRTLMNYDQAKSINTLSDFTYYHAKTFHLIVAIDQLQLVALPGEIKLKFEHLSVSFESLIYLLYQMLDEKVVNTHSQYQHRWQKTVEIIQFALSETKKLLNNKSLESKFVLQVASFYYLLEKLSQELQQIANLFVEPEHQQELHIWMP